MEEIESKVCRKCGNERPKNQFYSDSSKKDGLASYCKICEKERMAQWQKANPERVREKNRQMNKKPGRKVYVRNWKLVKKYGITVDEYNARLEAQGGVCAICESPAGRRPLDVDHCHKTGKIRSLLCTGCNVALGLLREDIGIAQKLIQYLEGHRCES